MKHYYLSFATRLVLFASILSFALAAGATAQPAELKVDYTLAESRATGWILEYNQIYAISWIGSEESLRTLLSLERAQLDRDIETFLTTRQPTGMPFKRVALASHPGALSLSCPVAGSCGTLRLPLATWTLAGSEALLQIRVVLRAAYVVTGNRQTSIRVEDRLRRTGLILAAREGLLPVGSGAKTVLTLDVDLDDWIVHDARGGPFDLQIVPNRALVGSPRVYRALESRPSGKDVRLAYRRNTTGGWNSISRVDLEYQGFTVRFAESESACDFDGAVLRAFESSAAVPAENVTYRRTAAAPEHLLFMDREQATPFPLEGLNRLPNGWILDISLLVKSAEKRTSAGTTQTLDLTPELRQDGLRLVPAGGFVPVCDDHIASLVLAVDADDFSAASAASQLAGRLSGELTAPQLFTKGEGGDLEVPRYVVVHAPEGAVENPLVVRSRQVRATGREELYPSQDPLFRMTMDRVGHIYDLKPDAQWFERPITIGLFFPESYRPEELALYTYDSEFGIWVADVPDYLPKHKEMVIEEYERVIAAKEASDDLNDHFPPDLSHIPSKPYEGLVLHDVNKTARQGVLYTLTNHFCMKSLFADLNVPGGHQSYAPLLDGALDDMCQTEGFGWVRNSNHDVHCGGSLPTPRDLRLGIRKTRRIIDHHGVALRVRPDIRNLLNDIPPPPTPGYHYTLADFGDDVEWAVNVWREAINRNPDGSYTERFRINCRKITDHDDGCAGDEIDIGIMSFDDTAGKTYGKNINLAEDLLMDAVNDDEPGRVRLRGTLLHEMGHVLGLDHWAGPGTLMSYQGRNRHNEHRENLCGTYTLAQQSLGLPEQCRLPELGDRAGTIGPVSGFGMNERMNRVTCTDTERIRQQIRKGSDWAAAEPLQCEILTERSEYAVAEMPVYDDATHSAYFDLNFDVRFPHCGDPTEFDRLELEIFAVDASNQTRSVHNLYPLPQPGSRFPGFYTVDPIARDGDGFYTVPIQLESRRLDGHTGTVHPQLGQAFGSFREYMDASADIANLAMVLKAYRDTTTGGVRDEFVAASSGLLRSPILSPVDGQIKVSVTDIRRGGGSVAVDPISIYPDFISAPDLFPYIDDGRLKPNVGRVLYVVVPPRSEEDLEGGEGNYTVELTWEAPDLEFVSGSFGPARIWVGEIEVFREDVPTIDDWEAAGGAPLSSDLEMTVPAAVTTPPANPCGNLSGSFELPALGERPLREFDVGGTTLQAWELYHVRFHYRYVHYGASSDADCTPDHPVCEQPGVCTQASQNLLGDRTEDLYISISGPSGAIVKPAGADSWCLYDAKRNGKNPYSLEANISGLKAVARAFPGIEFEARLAGSGRAQIALSCTNRTYGSSWVPVDEDTASILRTAPCWQNNCNGDNSAYHVALRYRYRPVGSTEWNNTDGVEIDAVRLRIEARNSCPGGFDISSSAWEDYECPDD